MRSQTKKAAEPKPRKVRRRPLHAVAAPPDDLPSVAKPRKSKYLYAYPETTSKLTDDVVEKMCELIACGHSFAEICGWLGIDPGVLQKWRRRGEAVIAGDEPDDRDWEIYGRWLRAMRKAAAKYIMTIEGHLHTSKDWFRFFKIAERRMPAVYGQMSRLPVEDDYDPDEAFL